MRRSTRMSRPTLSGSSRSAVLLGNDGDGSTLTLDFTTGQLDPRLTFSRTSNATFINSSGLVEWAAANFMTQSNNFAVSPWSSTNVTMSIDGSSPVGDAWKMLENNVNNVHRLDPSGVSYGNNGLPVTFSVYVKQGSGSRQAYFAISDNATGDVRSKRLNPVTGSLEGSESVGGSWTNASTSVQSVGGGWYRLVLTVTKNAGTAVICRTGMSDSSGNLSYAGDNTSFLYFAGYQINPGTSAQPYNATTGSTYTAPRFDYDPTTRAPKGLLIEGTATNVCLRSEDFGNAVWQPDNSGATNPVVSTVSQTAPNGASSVNRVTLNKTGGTFSRLYQAITGTAGQTYTMSVWMKANTANGGAATQNVGLRIGGSTGINCVVTTTWQRFTHPAFAITGTDANFQLLLWDNIPANDETADVLVWGAQVELGSGASSYIPTGASTVQRLADKMSMVDISTMAWNQTQGTFLLHMDVAAETNTSAFPAMMGMYTATPVRVVRFLLNNSSGTNPRIGCDTWTAAPAQILTSLIARSSAPTAFKYAAALSNTGQALSHVVNNGSVTTTTGTGTLQTPTRMLWHQDPSALDTEYFPVHIRTVKYWPTNLPDATLKAITT